MRNFICFIGNLPTFEFEAETITDRFPEEFIQTKKSNPLDEIFDEYYYLTNACKFHVPMVGTIFLHENTAIGRFSPNSEIQHIHTPES